MRLSEAMLLGSIGTLQATGALRRPGNRTCALGAAFVAAGIKCAEIPREASCASCGQQYNEQFKINADALEAAKIIWPILDSTVPSPITGEPLLLHQAIIVLNDCYRWTRPQIAKWVASIESQKPSTINQEVHECDSVKQSV